MEEIKIMSTVLHNEPENKKIAILTINDYNNYGNRLQNYATQEVLSSLGFFVETVVNDTNSAMKMGELNRNVIRKIKNIIIKETYSKFKNKLWDVINKKSIIENSAARINRFKNFSLVNINETNYSISKENIPICLSESYDFFITGSDQVWNPIYRQGSFIDFLTFAPKEKRIAYAPSFGISKIPMEYQRDYKTWLADMNSLSVRESAGAKIIKDLTGRDAIVLVDPTLMLTKDKWLSISKKSPNKPSKPYLITYFLGVIPNETRKKIKEIANENNLVIINLADKREPQTYIADPSEFIDYINSASVLCTDSFHGAVFSILLETPFIVFDRNGNTPSMNSRIETLLSTFKLESRLDININNNQEIFQLDYSHVDSILEVERKKALNYLKEALGVRDSIEV